MRHGSLQYWPHRRAFKRMPRLRSSPRADAPGISNIVAYKAGMTHVLMMDDSNSPSKDAEIARPCTVLEIPKMEVYGIRFYGKDAVNGYTETDTEVLDKKAAEKLGMKNVKSDSSKLAELKGKQGSFSDVTLLIAAYPSDLPVEQHHPMRFETEIGGKDLAGKVAFAEGVLGKEVSAADVFKNGEFVDVLGITKGKGWAGVIKRFGVKRNFHKATQKIRHGGPLGSFGDGRVFFTLPRAGQMGFNYRTEHNKRILKIGQQNEAANVNRKGGFQNYGNVNGNFILMDGSVPGVAKRLVRIRKSIRYRNKAGVKEPKLTFIAQ